MVNVINFHCIDNCNFNCKYCFVAKEGKQVDFYKAKICVDKIAEYFQIKKIEDGRINLAGGEPLLYSHIVELVDYIYSKNIKVSIITNGYLINEKLLNKIGKKISMIGISVDGLSSELNKKLGRCCNNIALGFNEYLSRCLLVKKYNIKLKINICVNKLNIDCDFFDFLEKAQPDRVKILQMVVQDDINNTAREFEINEKDFICFAQKYKKFEPIIEKSNDINNSYVILDSNCCLSTTNNHRSTNNLLNCTFEQVFNQIEIDSEKFKKRYR